MVERGLSTGTAFVMAETPEPVEGEGRRSFPVVTRIETLDPLFDVIRKIQTGPAAQ